MNLTVQQRRYAPEESGKN